MEKYIENIHIPEYIKRIKIDIGLSYAAPQSNVWLKHDDDLFVFGFEPNPESVEILRNGNIQKQQPFHGDPISDEDLKNRYCLIPVALENVSTPSEMQFYMMQNDCGTSSLYVPNEYVIGSIKQVTNVPVYSLKHFFDVFPWHLFNSIDYIEYLKIDAQGSDLNILKSAGDYLSERVVYVTAEAEEGCYLNCNNNNTYEMDNYMNSQGFIRVYDKETNDPTYLNQKFEHLKDQIYIYQQG